MAKPASKPSARFRRTSGEVGELGGTAGVIVVASTVCPVVASSGENFWATLASWGPTAFAIRAAPSGELSTAVISRTEAVGGTAALTFTGALGGKPSVVRSGSRTDGDRSTST